MASTYAASATCAGERGYVEEERVELDLPPDIKISNRRTPHPERDAGGRRNRRHHRAHSSSLLPASLSQGRKAVPDWESAERDYYRRTGFFRSSHGGIRRELYEREPWIAPACTRRSSRPRRQLPVADDEGAIEYFHALVHSHINRAMAVFWPDPYEYGVEPNRKLLDAVTRYSFGRGSPTASCRRRIVCARDVDLAAQLHAVERAPGRYGRCLTTRHEAHRATRQNARKTPVSSVDAARSFETCFCPAPLSRVRAQPALRMRASSISTAGPRARSGVLAVLAAKTGAGAMGRCAAT